MDNGLYKDFLDNPETYRACEQFWGRLTDGIANSSGKGDKWPQWEPRTYGDGETPFPDEYRGNPIHDGWSRRLDRAFRIIQHRAKGDRYSLGAWISVVDLEHREVPGATLVISLTLSEGTARLAEKLLRKWMTPSTTIDEMQVFIDENVPRPPRPGDPAD